MTDLRPRVGTSVHQFSFVDALVAGLLDGAFTTSEILDAGNLGVGCGDALDGELVLIDGVLRVCRAGGSVEIMDEAALVPFAEVVHFEPTCTLELTEGMGEREFDSVIENLVPSQNLFYAIRVEAEFASVSLREAARQQRPFPGLADAVKTQRENSLENTTGTMVGFKGPDVFQGLSVADFHLHYLDAQRAAGGHVLDFEVRSGTVQLQAFSSFTLRLPEVESYLDAALEHLDSDEVIRRVE